MTTHTFAVDGGYRFANTFDLASNPADGAPFVFAQAGQLTGAFRFRFKNGAELRAHIGGATANRVTAEGGRIFGTMQLNMGEAEAAAPGTNLLYLAYEGDVSATGSRITVNVAGQFLGGTGRYKGATGTMKVTSVNGFFADGTGTLILAENNTLPISAESTALPSIADGRGTIATAFPITGSPDPAMVHVWVTAYFKGTRTGDAARWAKAFATDAVVDDPVGAPIKNTPKAILAQGEAFVKAFKEIGLFESFVHVVGREAVAKWQGRGTTSNGETVTFEGINHFTFDDAGKITKLRGFFIPPGM
jgi:steroid Delta-isomerase